MQQHPTTVWAFTERAKYIAKHGKALPPSRTQQFQKKQIDVHRLMRPRSAQLAAERSGGFGNSGDNDIVDFSFPTDANEGIGATPKAKVERKVSDEQERCIAVQRPSAAAYEKTLVKAERLDRSRVSDKLYAAIRGHSAGTPNPSGGYTISMEDVEERTEADAEFERVMAAEYRREVKVLTNREYNVVRQLFTEIDDDGNGYLELGELIAYRSAHPKKLSAGIFQNLTLDETDGKVYLDEFIKVHFPNLTQIQIENAIEINEPKAQDVTMLSQESKELIEATYHKIVREKSSDTLPEYLKQHSKDDDDRFTLMTAPLMQLLLAPYFSAIDARELRAQQLALAATSGSVSGSSSPRPVSPNRSPTTTKLTASMSHTLHSASKKRPSLVPNMFRDDGSDTMSLCSGGGRTRHARGGAPYTPSVVSLNETPTATARSRSRHLPNKRGGGSTADYLAAGSRSGGNALHKRLSSGMPHSGDLDTPLVDPDTLIPTPPSDVMNLYQMYQLVERAGLPIEDFVHMVRSHGVNLQPVKVNIPTLKGSGGKRLSVGGGRNRGASLTAAHHVRFKSTAGGPLVAGSRTNTPSPSEVGLSPSAMSLQQAQESSSTLRRPSLGREGSTPVSGSLAGKLHTSSASVAFTTTPQPHQVGVNPAMVEESLILPATNEPNIPLMMTIPVTLHNFTVLSMEYYVLHQTGGEVPFFNPRLKEILAAYTWPKMFPHTGEIKTYFRRPEDFVSKRRKAQLLEEEKERERRHAEEADAMSWKHSSTTPTLAESRKRGGGGGGGKKPMT